MTDDDFWASVLLAAAASRARPQWMRAGIELDCRHFETSCKGCERCRDVEAQR